LNEILTVS